MSNRTEPWAPGTPCWVDYGASDLETTKRFYAALFGWEYSGGDPEYGGYLNAELKGAIAAGLAPKQDESQPSAWTTYFATADVDATVTKIREAGGTVVVEPSDVAPFGRMAIAIDPAGVGFGVWRARDHIGSGIVNEPGALTWNEIQSPDPDASRAFYAAVFGYSYDPVEGAENYHTFATDGGEAVGGIGGLHGEPGKTAPPQWHCYFMVNDLEAAVATVTEHGGTVLDPPFDSPFGRMAVVADPEGASFTLAGPAPQE